MPYLTHGNNSHMRFINIWPAILHISIPDRRMSNMFLQKLYHSCSMTGLPRFCCMMLKPVRWMWLCIFHRIHDDVIKWKHFPRCWPFVRGIHRSPVNSPHKGQWRGALMFSIICVWINGWVNNRKAGDLRRYRPLWRHRNVHCQWLSPYLYTRTYPPIYRHSALMWVLYNDWLT